MSKKRHSTPASSDQANGAHSTPDRAIGWGKAFGKSNPSTDQTIERDGHFGAGAAGAGGGTILILVAQNLPESHPWKSWLVTTAPAVTVGVSAMWLWIRSRVNAHLSRKDRAKRFHELRSKILSMIANPETSDAHRDALRRLLEKIEIAEVEYYAIRLKELENEM